jgi:hypothetical protein
VADPIRKLSFPKLGWEEVHHVAVEVAIWLKGVQPLLYPNAIRGGSDLERGRRHCYGPAWYKTTMHDQVQEAPRLVCCQARLPQGSPT